MTFTLDSPPQNFVAQTDFTYDAGIITTLSTGGIFCYGDKDFTDIEVRVIRQSDSGVIVDWYEPEDFSTDSASYIILVDGIAESKDLYLVGVRDKNNISNTIESTDSFSVGDTVSGNGQSNQQKWMSVNDTPKADPGASFVRVGMPAGGGPPGISFTDWFAVPAFDGIREWMDLRSSLTGAQGYIDLSEGGLGIDYLLGDKVAANLDPVYTPTVDVLMAEYSRYAKTVPSFLLFTGTENDATTVATASFDYSPMPKGEWVRKFLAYKESVFKKLSNKHVQQPQALTILLQIGTTTAAWLSSTDESWNAIRQANYDAAMVDESVSLAGTSLAFTYDDDVHYDAAGYRNAAKFVSGQSMHLLGDATFNDYATAPIIEKVEMSGTVLEITMSSPNNSNVFLGASAAQWECFQDGAAITLGVMGPVGRVIRLTTVGYNAASPLTLRYGYQQGHLGAGESVLSTANFSQMLPTNIEVSDQPWLYDGISQEN